MAAAGRWSLSTRSDRAVHETPRNLLPFSSSRQQCARASAQTSGAGWQTPMDFH